MATPSSSVSPLVLYHSVDLKYIYLCFSELLIPDPLLSPVQLLERNRFELQICSGKGLEAATWSIKKVRMLVAETVIDWVDGLRACAPADLFKDKKIQDVQKLNSWVSEQHTQKNIVPTGFLLVEQQFLNLAPLSTRYVSLYIRCPE